MEPHPLCILNMEALDPGLVYLQKSLDGLVQAGTVTQEDADHYVECVRNAPQVGEPMMANLMFAIKFTKKAV